jgi:molybdopterin-guanine dinucleotide biosynthesis protein A
MNKTPDKISCIILAGGRGKRAGDADKGLVTYKGKPLIQYVIDKIGPQTDEIIISAKRNLDVYSQYTDKVVSDSIADYQGPLSGIASCLSHCKHEQVLIVACDMPSLPDDLVARLNEKLHDNAICIATVNHRHQLALLIKNNLSDSIQTRVNTKRLKLIDWVESLPHAMVNFDDEANAFLNLNTITDKN